MGLAAKLQSQITMSDSDLSGQYHAFLDAWTADVLTTTERQANADKRALTIKGTRFLDSKGDLTIYRAHAGSVWGLGVDLVTQGKKGQHLSATPELVLKVEALEAYLASRVEEFKRDLKARLEKEGFRVTIRTEPNYNYRYANGIQEHHLMIDLAW